MFFLVTGLEKTTEKDLAFLTPYLSEQRKEKVSSLRFFPDKTASATAFVLLRCAALRQCGRDRKCEFGFSEAGKPFFLSRADVRFSLSHDRKGVGVAVSENEIGADVQEIFPYEKSLAERILSPRERSVFDRVGCDDEVLTRMWTMKESLGKKTGEGVFSVMERTDFSQPFTGSKKIGDNVYTVGKKDGLYFSVCSDKPEEVIFMDWEEFKKSCSRLKRYSDLVE